MTPKENRMKLEGSNYLTRRASRFLAVSVRCAGGVQLLRHHTRWKLFVTAGACSLWALWPYGAGATVGTSPDKSLDVDAPWNGHKVIRTLSPGFMRPDVRLEVIDTSPPGSRVLPVPEALQISHDGHHKRLVRLNDLRGYVNIQTVPQSLRYVRLAAPIASFTLLDQPQDGLEIVSEDSLPKSSVGSGGQFLQSGSGGILSRQAYQAGGFHPPIIRKTTHGFIIDRWIFEFQAYRLRKIREYVSFDGRYRRKTLKLMRHPPKLPHTEWRIHGLE